MEHGTGTEQPKEMGEHRISFRGCLPVDVCFLFRRGVLEGVTEKVVKLDCQREPCPDTETPDWRRPLLVNVG